MENLFVIFLAHMQRHGSRMTQIIILTFKFSQLFPPTGMNLSTKDPGGADDLIIIAK